MEKDRIEMNRREREVLKVMSLVLKGERTQAEAAALLKRGVRQVRRIQRRMEAQGDGAVVHRLRGRASNHRIDAAVRAAALAVYREELMGFGPTLAAEKLAERQISVSARSLHLWLVEEGLWEKSRRGRRHRSRRVRRSCFGEMIQADGSEHDWLEGRGPRMVLLGMIDDATGRILARFYPAETTAAYMDLLWRWLKRYGRPVSWYSDRDSVFHAQLKRPGEEPISVPTQFSRALQELDIELILAHSPQAKGRIERLWGTLQDRWVKELRLAKVTTMQEANALLENKLIDQFNRRFVKKPADRSDGHRRLDRSQDLAVILCSRHERRVNNDYTIRFANTVYQLLPPAWPGQRGGHVEVQQRLDGSLRIRFGTRYLQYKEIDEKALNDAGAAAGVTGALPPNGEAKPHLPQSLAHAPIPAEWETARSKSIGPAKDRAARAARSSAVHRAAGRSGRTSAEPCPSGGKSCGSGKSAWRPASNHPWRNAAKPDIPICAK